MLAILNCRFVRTLLTDRAKTCLQNQDQVAGSVSGFGTDGSVLFAMTRSSLTVRSSRCHSASHNLRLSASAATSDNTSNSANRSVEFSCSKCLVLSNRPLL